MTDLSPDRPNTNPKEDLFGHAPFAERLADSICRYPGNDGLVLALYGPWGSGKSTTLEYVRHYLDERGEDERPIVVTFNPWWFSGQEHLARAFLGQLQAVLPGKSKKFKKLGELFGDFSEGIGGVIDLTGMTGGAGGKVGKLLSGLFKKKPKDVPALKDEITRILKDAEKRILVLIDDIDRLTPAETRQLFTVIKALADFPNVVYLLAFDREVAVQAIEQQTGMPGARYLEKIVQVPFELPPVDRVALRAALFKRLDAVLIDMPEGAFDKTYWTNVYFDGIDQLIDVPRDVVRLTNTIAVTFPSVHGEVNPVDFIALEAIRVFLPDLYDTIRANPDRFSGHSHDGSSAHEHGANEEFHERWRNEIPEPVRDSTKALLERIFPKTGSMGYGSDWLSEWRRELRACHPDIFPIYFSLTLPSGAVSRKEVEALLDLTDSPSEFAAVLIRAKGEKRPDGLSKARELLERLMDHVEKDIPEANISNVIGSLLDIGDDLIDPADEAGMFDFGNVSRVSRPVYHLLKRLPTSQRVDVLRNAIEKGRAVAVQSWLLRALEEEVEKSENELLSAEDVGTVKSAWIDRVKTLSQDSSFIAHPELSRVLAFWRRWGDEDEVRTCVDGIIETDEGLLRLLAGFVQYTKSQTMGDSAVRIQPRLNPKWLEVYLDTTKCAERLRSLQQKGGVPADADVVVEQFLREYEMLEEGKDPDGIGAFDD